MGDQYPVEGVVLNGMVFALLPALFQAGELQEGFYFRLFR